MQLFTRTAHTRDVHRPGIVRSIIDLVVTTDRKQRACIMVQLLTSAIMAVCIGAIAFTASLGMVEPHEVYCLGSLGAVSSLTFFTLIRSGINRRFADPTLAFPQTIVAQSLVTLAYFVGGPFHGAALLLYALVMVFGMFSMRGRAIRFSCIYTLAILAPVMVYRTRANPVEYPVLVETFYFVLLATVLPAISGLSSNLMAMRQRLKEKQVALEEALVRIHELATRDELTGLPNRRFMMAQLQERARSGPPFHIGMVDLDHFKSINDTYGHAVGDDVLRAFGALAGNALRPSDLIGRWGGEEFLLVLAETQEAPALGLARLRIRLGAAEMSAVEPQLRVAFSSGTTRYVEGEPIGQAIERADRALYQAKSNGRNQSVVL